MVERKERRKTKTKAVINLMRAKGINLDEAIVEIENDKKAIIKTHYRTDEDILQNQFNFFKSVDLTAKQTVLGNHNSLIIMGTAGIGKTYGIEKILKKYNGRSVSITGKITTLALYTKLYEYRFKGDVVFIDDCDSILKDNNALNILKGALDSKPIRTVTWGTTRQIKNYDGDLIPDSFIFSGSVIFSTNMNLESKQEKNMDLKALISRSPVKNFFDIFKNPRDLKIRLDYLLPMILKDNNVKGIKGRLITDFVAENGDKIKNMSMRIIVHLIGITNYDDYTPSTFNERAYDLVCKSVDNN